jgi:serine/threonine-protein kinase RsbT
MKNSRIAGSSPVSLPPPTFLLPHESELSVVVQIRGMADIVNARQSSRQVSNTYDASEVETTFITTIISELARNILIHAHTGEIQIDGSVEDGRAGVTITARDRGPGISDLRRALIGGYSTCGRMGLGLCGVQRMADEFKIESEPEKGTTVTARKWLA